MHFNNMKNVAVALIILCLLVGCGKNIDNNSAQYATSDNSIEQESNEPFDYDSMGIEEYSYPKEFILEEDIKNAIEQVALVEEFDATAIDSETWKRNFINYFIKSDFDGYEYKKITMKANDGFLDRKQIEYINYSLTGKLISFDDIDDKINCRENVYSQMMSYCITDYRYEMEGETVIVIADADCYRKGDSTSKKNHLTVRLVPNKYSCFNGYSIEKLDQEEIEQTQMDDGNKHEITWYCNGEDVSNNKISGEFCDSEDSLKYGVMISVNVTEEQKKYILDNVPAEFKILYECKDEMEYPICSITAKDIKLAE